MYYSWGYAGKKIQRITHLYNVGEQEAVKMMADTDKRRMANYNFYTEQNLGKSQQLYVVSEQFRDWI